MTWLFAILLAIAAFLAIMVLSKAARKGWEAVGAALLLGIAGYGLQASPGLPGAPKPPAQQIASDPDALIEGRGDLDERSIPTTNQWVVIADGMARNGQFANAAQVLLGAVDEDPEDGEAWLALANALVAHADGQLTPASDFAFRKAARIAPESPGPPFFRGLALAQTGRFDEARAIWTRLLERAPPDAPWREDIEFRLEQLMEFIRARDKAQAGG